MNKQILSEEFQRMQKLAGIITETEGKSKVLSELRFIDKIKAAFGIQPKVDDNLIAKTVYTKRIDGVELNPDQEEVGNEIIMSLNDINKGKPYVVVIKPLVDNSSTYGLTSEPLIKQFIEKLKSKGLEVTTSVKSEYSPEFDSGDYRPISLRTDITTITITKK